MPDREKVIKGLERISEWLFQQYRVVYDGDAPNYYDAYKTVDDALALLKEQEPVEPVPEHPVVINTLACGACHAQVARWDMFPRMSRDAKRVYLFRAKYCWRCGREVDWNENH